MNSDMHIITSKQLMVLIISTQIGVGILFLPAILAKNTGHDGWISILLGGILSILALIIILILLKRYSDKSILDINQLLYGKYLGKFINMIFLSYIYFSAVVSLRLFGEIVQLTVMKLTPPIILTFFIFIPTTYVTWYGLKVICRFSNIILFIILCVFLYWLLIYKNFRIFFLMPIGEAGMEQILKSIYPSFFAYLGFELVAIVYPYISDKEKTMKYAVTANIISTAFHTFIVIITTGVYGETMIRKLVFPIFSMASIYKAPVLDRLDLFFISLWFPAMVCSFSVYFFSAYHVINKMFNIKKNLGFYAFFIFITILLSRIPKDFVDSLKFMKLLNTYGIIVISFLVICTLFSFINKRGVRKK